MGNIGFRELLVLLLLGLLIFGTKKLRSIGSDLGGAVRDFKKAMDGGEQQGTPPPAAPPAPQIQQTDANFHAQSPAAAPGAQAEPPKHHS
jgi:sec-independent protein translocase protein TatA